jgi:hypothetical protein
MRWRYLCNLFREHLEEGVEPPTTIIKVMDNCTAQNKSNTSAMFDMACSVIFNLRILCLYLKPGHSHMRADAAVAQAKNLLRGRNWFCPQEMADRVSTGKNMRAAVLTRDDFQDWEPTLGKYFKRLPVGFTRTYKWLFEDGVLRMYGTADSDEPVHTMEWAPNVTVMRKALLHDIVRLPATATLEDIVVTPTVLPKLPLKDIADTKLESLLKKLKMVPQQYQAYFPQGGAEGHAAAGADEGPAADAEADSGEDLRAGPQRLRRRVGRPPKEKPAETGTQSLLAMWGQSQSQSHS